MLAQIAAQSLHLRQDELRVMKQRVTGGRWAHASTISLQQSRSEHLLHPFHARARRRKRDACARSANGNAALLHYGGEQAQVGKIKMRGAVLDELPFCLWCRQRQGYENPSLRLLEATDNYVGMSNPIVYLVVVAAAFLVAGLVKGVTGLALPTGGAGLLSLAMPPGHAAALIVVPALITNVWQMISGPGLGRLVRRLWPMQLGICLGTWAGARLIAGCQTAFYSA